jgi:hypothetical protein
MQYYRFLAHQAGTPEAIELASRLIAWHDAMVAHERAIKREVSGGCDEPCPHAEALDLWREAQQVFGQGALELAFLRAQAAKAAPPPVTPGAGHDRTRRTRSRPAPGAGRGE